MDSMLQKTTSKKVVHKTAEATRGLIGNVIAQKIVKSKPVPETNPRNVGKIVISPEKMKAILSESRQLL